MGGTAVPLVLMLLCTAAMGQWSPDSTENLPICDLAGEQVTPKIAGTSDGGCFISWFDQRSGDYCMYLQRLDYQGVPQFPENGLLISDHPQMTWLVDHSLAVDNEDNAILAFSDTRSPDGDLDVSVYKISGSGDFLWGPDGISLSDTSEAGFEPNPVIAVTGGNECVVAWGKSVTQNFLVMQRLAPDGTRLWGDWGITIQDPDADLSSPVVVPSGDNGVIALWKRSTGTYPMTVTHLYAQRFDETGDGVWGDSPALVYSTGAITPWTFPEMIPDGSGGAVCSWYDAPSLSEFNVWVQHIDSEGNMLYPANGAQASTNSSDRLHMSPSAAINPATGETYVFWTETNGNQDQWGIYAQMFNTSGERQWTDSGLELVPLGGQQTSFATALVNELGVFAAYLINPSAASLRVFSLGFDGTPQWGPVTVAAGSNGGKDDPVVCPGADNSLVFTWTDNRTDAGIYAQNIKSDGSLGQFTGIEEGSTQGTCPVTVSPNPSHGHFSITISSETPYPYSLEIFDLSGRLVETIHRGEQGGSLNAFSWQTGDVSPGIYFLRLASAGEETVKRLTVLPRR